MELNFLDFSIIGIILLSIFFGFRKGLIVELFWIFGIVFGIVFATCYQGNIISFIEVRWHRPLAMNTAGVFIIILLSTILIFSFLGRICTFISRRHKTLSVGNRLGGALFGFARGVLIIALVLTFMLKISLPASVNLQIYRSNFSRLILRHSFQAYERIMRLLPAGKTFVPRDFVSSVFPREKIEQLKDTTALNIYQEFFNNVIEDKEEFIPEQFRELKKGGKNET